MAPETIRQRLQPGRDIHPIAEDVVFLDDHVTKVDPNPKSNAPVLRSFRIALGHSALDFGRASYCVHHARELGKEAVAGVFHNSAPVFRDLRVDQFLEVRLQALVRSLLIHPHQPRVPGDISGEDCGETSGDGHPVGESRPPEADIHGVLVEGPVLGSAPRLSCALS